MADLAPLHHPPPSRARRKVDQFRTLASRAASRLSDLRWRIGSDFKGRKSARRTLPLPLPPLPHSASDKHGFPPYGQDDIFINPLETPRAAELNVHKEDPSSIYRENPNAPVYSTYQRIDDDHDVSAHSTRPTATNVAGVRRGRYAGRSIERNVAHSPEPEEYFEASELTTNYDALCYLAGTRRFAMFAAMWRHFCKLHYQSDILHEACRRGHAALAGVLLGHGVDVDGLDEDNASALYYAVACGRADCVRLLVRHGASVAVNPDLEPGRSLLHTAARAGHLAVTHALLEVLKHLFVCWFVLFVCCCFMP